MVHRQQLHQGRKASVIQRRHPRNLAVEPAREAHRINTANFFPRLLLIWFFWLIRQEPGAQPLGEPYDRPAKRFPFVLVPAIKQRRIAGLEELAGNVEEHERTNTAPFHVSPRQLLRGMQPDSRPLLQLGNVACQRSRIELYLLDDYP